MASLGAFLNLQRRPTAGSLRSLLDIDIPVEQEVNILAEAAEERQKQDAAGPSFRPANPMQSILEQEKYGAFNALQNIPISPLASAVELMSPGAYDAMTAPVEGANPEVPNMLAGLDQMSLGGLIDTPVAAGLLRTKAPSMREMAPARLRGRPAGSLGDLASAEPAPAFYSQARTVLDDPKTQGTQTGEAWTKFLTDPKRGVKSEEMQYTGLGDFLKSKGGQRVTREEIQGHLDANEIEIREVTKGAPHEIAWEPDTDYPGEVLHGRAPDAAKSRYVVMKARSGPRAGKWIMEDSADSGVTGTFDTQEAAQRAATYALGMERSGQPKFSQYTLPGAENYREVLLTLAQPQKLTAKPMGEGRWQVLDDGGVGIGSGMGATAEEAIADYGSVGQTLKGRYGFQSGHWGEPDVLAHLRLSDRTDGDGKRTLLVEEIQSDWAQKGRKEGFADPTPLSFDAWKAKHFADSTLSDETLRSRYAIAAEQGATPQKSGIPTAPFVTDTGKWTALSLKRVLKMAADGGYDRIGIVPGVEQAKRYDLSKQLDKVEVRRNEGTDRLTVYASKDGSNVITKQSSPDRLDEVIGKELADRVLSDMQGKSSTVLEGLDLAVGGEGMKGYYDKIVPDTLNKLAKEYGVKVNLEGGRVPAPSGSKWLVSRQSDGSTLGTFASKEEALKAMDAEASEGGWTREEYNLGPASDDIPIHTLDVPEPMKKNIKAKGFPLYSKAGTLGSLIGAQNA